VLFEEDNYAGVHAPTRTWCEEHGFPWGSVNRIYDALKRLRALDAGIAAAEDADSPSARQQKGKRSGIAAKAGKSAAKKTPAVRKGAAAPPLPKPIRRIRSSAPAAVTSPFKGTDAEKSVLEEKAFSYAVKRYAEEQAKPKGRLGARKIAAEAKGKFKFAPSHTAIVSAARTYIWEYPMPCTAAVRHIVILLLGCKCVK